MRKLYKKQERLIEQVARENYIRDKRAMFISAYELSIYDALNKIHCYECMDSDIERFYSDTISKLTLTRGKA